ncbi:MAG: hypothetical protein ACJ8AW_39905 [Rhodopila sp.]
MNDDGSEAFDTPCLEVFGERGVGITLYPVEFGGCVWMPWDETLALHEWLSALLKASEPPMSNSGS